MNMFRVLYAGINTGYSSCVSYGGFSIISPSDREVHVRCLHVACEVQEDWIRVGDDFFHVPLVSGNHFRCLCRLRVTCAELGSTADTCSGLVHFLLNHHHHRLWRQGGRGVHCVRLGAPRYREVRHHEEQAGPHPLKLSANSGLQAASIR